MPGSLNIMFKFADDTYLSPLSKFTSHPAAMSYNTSANGQHLNVSKSSEIIFTSSYQRRKTPLPATIPGISRSDYTLVLFLVPLWNLVSTLSTFLAKLQPQCSP